MFLRRATPSQPRRIPLERTFPMNNSYGHFDDSSREFVITRPDTPRPLAQLPGADDFFRPLHELRGRLHVLARRQAPPPDPLPLQQTSRWTSADVNLYVRDGETVWNPDVEAVPDSARQIRMPPRARLHADHRGKGRPRSSRSCSSSRPGRNRRIWQTTVRNKSALQEKA